MTEQQEMEQTLLELRDLLAEDGQLMPAQSMHDLYHDWRDTTDPRRRSDIGRLILRLYGGMGSFNDVILELGHDKDVVFRDLRQRLWELALHFVQ